MLLLLVLLAVELCAESCCELLSTGSAQQQKSKRDHVHSHGYTVKLDTSRQLLIKHADGAGSTVE